VIERGARRLQAADQAGSGFQQAAAGGNRRVHLKLIGGGEVALDDEVPATRADCPTERPCGHVRCRFHLWRVDGHDRRGRRTADGKHPATTLRPAWADWPVPPSCTLDLVELAGRPGWNVIDMAHATGLEPSQFRDVAARAIAKLRAAGAEVRRLAGEVAEQRSSKD